MFFFHKGDVGIESVYGCLRQLRLDERNCRDSKCKPFLNCLQIPSDLAGRVFAYVPSKATWHVSVLLTPF